MRPARPAGRQPLSALVLAGGAASRMGGAKAGLPLGGRSLLEHALALAATVADETLLLPGGRAELVAGPGVRRLPDWTLGEGPLRGLGAGLEAATHDWCLCLACDMPFVTAQSVALLLAEAERPASAGERAAEAVVLRGASGWEPFPSLVRRAALPRVRECLLSGTAGTRSFQGLFDTLSVRAVPVSRLTGGAPGLRGLCNLNTPSDLRAARDFAAETEK